MNTQLSFAHILQKKKINDLTNTTRISTSKTFNQPSNLSSQVTSQYFGSATPTTLSQMMSQYTEYPQRPQTNYILTFIDKNIKQSQDFQTRINPLDSWIMSQSHTLKTQKPTPQKLPRQLTKPHLIKNNSTKFKHQSNKQSPVLFDLNKQFNNIKQNKNQNFNLFLKSNSKNLNQQSHQQSLSQLLCNKQPIIHQSNKFIENHKFHNLSQDLKSINKLQNSQCKSSHKKISYQQQNSHHPKTHLSRYQSNYLNTSKKISSQINKNNNQEFSNQNLQDNKKYIQQPINKKKSSQQEQLLIAGLDDTHLLSQQQKRLQDARKQIQQYLQVKDKNINNKPSPLKQTHQILQIGNQLQPIISETNFQQITYSFAQNQKQTVNCPTDSFSHTKQQLKQIVEVNIAEQNQRMLSCIEYTLSQPDGNGEFDDTKKEGLNNSRCEQQFPTYARNLQLSQSIPQKKQNRFENEPCMLQKYLPAIKDINYQKTTNHPSETEKQSQSNHQFTLPTSNTKNPLQQLTYQIKIQQTKTCKISQDVQYSQMVQKFQILPQPSILLPNLPQPQKDEWSLNVLNSDHSKKFKQLIQAQHSPSTQQLQKPQQPYHDASSIDIYVSESSKSSNQSPPSQKQITIHAVHTTVQNIQNHLQVPQLHLKVSDVSSISNTSHPSSNQSHPQSHQLHHEYHQQYLHQKKKDFNARQSPRKCYFNDIIQHVQSNKPISQHQSINISANASNYGFIYAMKINSRNSSFTSNYNKSSTSSHAESYCSHNSLYIKQQKNENKNNIHKKEEQRKQIYNMTKNKPDHKVYIQSFHHQPPTQQPKTLQQPPPTITQHPITQQSITVARIIVNQNHNKQKQISQYSIYKSINQQWNSQLVSSISKIQGYQQISGYKQYTDQLSNVGCTLGHQTIIDQLQITLSSNLQSKQQAKLQFNCHPSQKQTQPSTQRPSQPLDISLYPTQHHPELKKQHCQQQLQQKQINIDATKTQQCNQSDTNKGKQMLLTPNLQQLIRYLKSPISDTRNSKWQLPSYSTYQSEENQLTNTEVQNIAQIEQQPKLPTSSETHLIGKKQSNISVQQKKQIVTVTHQCESQWQSQINKPQQLIQLQKQSTKQTQPISHSQYIQTLTDIKISISSQTKNTLNQNQPNLNKLKNVKNINKSIRGSFTKNQCLNKKDQFEFDMDF